MFIKSKRTISLALLTLVGLLWIQPAAWSAGKAKPPAAPAQSDEAAQLAARREALSNEQQSLARERTEVEALVRDHESRLKALAKEGLKRTTLEQAAFEADTLKLRLQSIEVDQQEAQRRIEDLEELIAALNEQLKGLRVNTSGTAAAGTDDPAAKLRAELEQKQAELQLEKDRLAHLQSAYQVAKEHHAVAGRWYQSVQQLFLTQQELNHAEALDHLQNRIQKEQQELLKQAEELRRRLAQSKGDDDKSRDDRRLLETQIQDAEEHARLKQVDLSMAQVKHRLDNLVAATEGTDMTPGALKGAAEQAESLVRDLEGTLHLVLQKVAVVEEQKQLLEKRSNLTPDARKQILQESQVVEGLEKDLKQKADTLQTGIQNTKSTRDMLKSRYDQSIERSLKIRRKLPPDMVTWKEAVLELLLLPKVLSQQSVATVKQIALAVEKNGPGRVPLLILAELAWLAAMQWLRHAFRSWMERFGRREKRFSVRLVLLVLDLLARNVTAAAIAGAAVVFLLLVERPQPATSIVLALASTVLIFKAALDLVWLVLAAPTAAESQRQPVLYRKLVWILALTALFTALTLLVHFLPTSLTIKDLVNRLFMFLLLLLNILVWRSRKLILSLLEALFAERPFWFKAAAQISLLLPMTILIAVLVGLVGYVNLASTIGSYLGWFLVVLVGWLLLHGLLQDLVNWLQTRVNIASTRSTAWRQGLIEPLHRLVKLGLFVGAWGVLFRLFGWDAQSPVVRGISSALNFPLFSMATRSFSILDLLLTGLIISLVVLAARWSREVTYRWVFSGVTDSGSRHSLSVFTQYAVVLIGVLMALRILGIDLTTFAIFAGALGVGVGLGLQNIANNFISGILLLIERPLRTGDYVTIGSNEGQVTRIGIRSLTVRTADNQEIIIPNAQVISNEFTNWTYSDSVVRMKLEVGISYQNDPGAACKIIEEVLADDPKVLESPLPRVWLKEYGESSVNLLIHYFIDMRKCVTWESKSQVLFAIWERFKAAGIEIPYPHREVTIRGGIASLAGKQSQ
jgi:potassium-dependent mechanosensitive channel